MIARSLEAYSREVCETLRVLQEQAKAGVVIGLAFGVVMRGRRYHVNVAGSLVNDPTFARGIVAALDDELQAMVHERAGVDRTL